MPARHIAIHTTLALGVAFLLSGAALAADMISVGGQAKHAIGTITDLQSGDVACYLVMKDDKGAEFTEMGDYSICDRSASLIGKTVRLKYELGQVLADSCQGNPDCGETKTVPLVMSVDILPE